MDHCVCVYIIGMNVKKERLMTIKALKKNFSEFWKKPCQMVKGFSEKEGPKWLKKPLEADRRVVLVNPPRAGLDRSFSEFLSVQRNIDSLFYISCDPAHLARDLSILLKQKHYQMVEIVPFDMFPRTKHVEVLAYLRRPDDEDVKL